MQYIGEISATLAALSWATAVIFLRLAGQKVKPAALISFTSTVALIGFILVILFFEDSQMPQWTNEAWLRLAISGFLGITVGDILIQLTLNRLGASLESIIACVYAPAIMLAAFLFFGETIPPIAFIGAASVILAIIIGSDKSDTYKVTALKSGLIFGVLSQFVMATSVIMIRDLYRSDSIIWIIAVRFAIGASILLTYHVWKEGISDAFKLFRVNENLKMMLPAAIFGPFAATMLWFVGFKYTLAGKAAVFNQLSTVFVFILAGVFLREPMTRKRIIAILLAFSGAIIVALA